MKYITKVAIPFGRFVVSANTPLHEDVDGDYCVNPSDNNLGWWTKEVIEANPFMFEAVPEPKAWTDNDGELIRKFALYFERVYCVYDKDSVLKAYNEFKEKRGIK